MPRRDPVTGVMVLTFPEMMAREAEANGRSIEAEYDDFYADVARMEQEELEELREHALEILQGAVREHNGYVESGECEGEPLQEPVEVIDLVDAEIVGGVLGGRQKCSIEAVVKREDGTAALIKWHDDRWAGTRLEPPEYDQEVWYEDEDT